MNDICNPHSLLNFLSYDKLSITHRKFSLVVSSTFESKYYHEAIKYTHWQEATTVKITILETN